MVMNLTARSVANLKPGASAFYVVDKTGLALRVGAAQHGGVKTWSVRYRIGRTQRRVTLGSYPALTLKGARKGALDALKNVSAGVDPATAKQARREADTFAELATDYIDKHAKPKKRSWRNDQRILDTEVLPHWKNRPAKAITRRDVRELIDGVAKRGPILANRVRALLSKLFNIAIQLDIVETNPVTGTARPGVEKQRDRVLTEDEIRQLWTATEGMTPIMAAVFKLRLITAQRGGEVIHMRWQDLDLVNGWWTIPSAHSKNKLPHRVPLAPSALDILTALRAAVDATKHSTEPIFVMVGARGNRQRGTAAKAFALTDFKGHDLRRTAASMMASSGTQRLVISKILNHVESSVTAVYDRHGYDGEKRIALDAWARTLTQILEHKEGANVLAFAK